MSVELKKWFKCLSMMPNVQMIAVAILPLLFAITLHEAAHGWVASQCGDKTALMLGRVTLNPLRHIDLVGTIIVPLVLLFLGGFIFGWAKPVPVAWQNLRHPRRDMAAVALAGPAANFLMALLWAAVAKSASLFLINSPWQWVAVTGQFLEAAANFGILINCVLLVLNLLPIPPLDGSRVISSLLPARVAHAYEKIEAFGVWILLALLVLGILTALLWPPIQWLSRWIMDLFHLTS
jgi:Zn-dependent protease